MGGWRGGLKLSCRRMEAGSLEGVDVDIEQSFGSAFWELMFGDFIPELLEQATGKVSFLLSRYPRLTTSRCHSLYLFESYQPRPCLRVAFHAVV